MRLEEQVCSLELAKQLKKLGIKQDAYFIWGKERGEFSLWNPTDHSDYETDGITEEYSAFTVSELGKMLPQQILDNPKKMNSTSYWLQFEPAEIGWSCQYKNIAMSYGRTKKFFEASKMVECGAQMLIWLIENRYISLPTEDRK